jgi:phasin family protein
MDLYKIESLAEINRTGYSNAVKLATLSLEKFERLAKLNLNTAKSALAGGARNAGAIAGVKDVPSLLALNAQLTAAGVESVLGYTRGVYGIGSEGQSAFSALAEDAWATYTKGVSAWVDQAGRNAPAGSQAAVHVLKSTLAATTAAFDHFSRASKEVASFADASARAAGVHAASMAKAATGQRKAA